jgi:hypothetical protein
LLAELDAEHKATPRRVEAARQLFVEATLDEFEAIGVTGRKLRHRETGREYVIAQDQVLMSRDPRRSGIEFFIIAGDRLWFLRPRGWHGDVEVGIPSEVISGELQRSPSGGVRVVDKHTGSSRDVRL